MLVNHERRLLTKAAEAVAGRISVNRERDRSWPSDHSRLCALQSGGDVRWLGEQAGPHIGGVFATWQITEQGSARLERLTTSISGRPLRSVACESCQAAIVRSRTILPANRASSGVA